MARADDELIEKFADRVVFVDADEGLLEVLVSQEQVDAEQT